MTSIDGNKVIKASTASKLVEKDGDRFRCLYRLLKKGGRQCNMTRRADEQFCAQHVLLVKDSIGGRKRIPCPLDAGHSIFEDQLKAHLKRCSARKVVPVDDPWYSVDLNVVGSESSEEGTPVTVDYAKWIPVIKTAYDSIPQKVVDRDIRQHEGLDARLQQLENKKHAIQQSSLIGHMDAHSLIDPGTTIMEFGCGRGELSRYIYRSQLLKRAQGGHAATPVDRYLLIDRSRPRMKFEVQMPLDFEAEVKKLDSERAKEMTAPVTDRLKIDIKDLELAKAPSTSNPDGLTAVSKHLCGCATDLTLQCLLNYCREPRATLKGIVIALCCRQLCTYETYNKAGRDWLASNGVTRDGFQALKRMTSWAICGTRGHEDVNHPSGLSHAEREEAGMLARRVIDHGRVLGVQAMGFEAKVVQYVDKQVSLENHCLVAYRQSTDRHDL